MAKISANIINEKLGQVEVRGVIYPTVVVGIPLFVVFFCQTLVPSSLQPILIALSLAFALFCSAKDRDKLGFCAGSIFLLLFYLWSMFDQNAAFGNAVTTSMFRTWLILFGCMMAAAVLLGHAKNRRWVSYFWGTLLVFGIFYSVVTIVCWLVPSFHDSIVQAFFSGSKATASALDWKAGFTNHYSTNGMYIAFGLIACVPMLAERKHPAFLRYAIVVIIMMALLLTTKRAHLVFGVASAGFALILFGSRKKLSTGLKVAVVALLALVALYEASLYFPDLLVVFDRFQEMSTTSEETDRELFVELCRRMWEQSPVLGSGMGTFAVYLNMTSLGAKYIAQGFSIMSAHNCFWQVLAEEGAIGLALFVGTLALFLAGTVRLLLGLNRANGPYGAERAALAASVALQLFFISYCGTGNPLYDMQTYVPYLLACGVYLAVRRETLGAATDRKQFM